MSGGSFQYLCYKEEADEIIRFKNEIKNMANYMREDGKLDASDEMEKLYLDVEMFARMIELRAKRLSDVMHAYEWWSSGDIGEEEFDEAWKTFLEV